MILEEFEKQTGIKKAMKPSNNFTQLSHFGLPWDMSVPLQTQYYENYYLKAEDAVP